MQIRYYAVSYKIYMNYRNTTVDGSFCASRSGNHSFPNKHIGAYINFKLFWPIPSSYNLN